MLAEIDLKCQLSCSIELKFLFIEINKALEVKNGFCPYSLFSKWNFVLKIQLFETLMVKIENILWFKTLC